MRNPWRLAVFLAWASCPAAAEPAARAVAVPDFAYIDTSGEAQDQTAAHAAKMAAFMTAFRGDLDKSGAWRAMTPLCLGAPCAATTPPDQLQASARAAGAEILLIGGVHKMSTLVQWAEVRAFDVKSGASLNGKVFTFRGDSDEAWRRAEKFIAEEFLAGKLRAQD